MNPNPVKIISFWAKVFALSNREVKRLQEQNALWFQDGDEKVQIPANAIFASIHNGYIVGIGKRKMKKVIFN